jgi:hypothetical protein
MRCLRTACSLSGSVNMPSRSVLSISSHNCKLGSVLSSIAFHLVDVLWDVDGLRVEREVAAGFTKSHLDCSGSVLVTE